MLKCISSFLIGMASHPPIPILELVDHIERLKANDNLKFSQEYEVNHCVCFTALPRVASFFDHIPENEHQDFFIKYDSQSDINMLNE